MADKPLPAAPHQPFFPGRTRHSLQFGAELRKFRQLSTNTAGNMTSSSPPPHGENGLIQRPSSAQRPFRLTGARLTTHTHTSPLTPTPRPPAGCRAASAPIGCGCGFSVPSSTGFLKKNKQRRVWNPSAVRPWAARRAFSPSSMSRALQPKQRARRDRLSALCFDSSF